MPVDHGGQAFPVTIHSLHVKGMTLREYYAGQALAGVLANPRILENTPADEIAEVCFDAADAMLAERKKGTDAKP